MNANQALANQNKARAMPLSAYIIAIVLLLLIGIPAVLIAADMMDKGLLEVDEILSGEGLI